jgi:hypothetical protein
MNHLAPLQQTAVSGEKSPLFVAGDSRQFLVVAVGLVGSIEAQHAEVPRESPEMGVQNEAAVLEWRA